MRTYDSYKDSEIEWIGEIPKHWEFLRLGFIVDTIVPMRDKPTDLSGPIPWIRIEDRIGRYIEKSKSNQGVTEELIKEMNLKVYPIGTVLCSCSCSFGKTMIVKEPLTSNQTFIGLVPNDIRLKSEFLSFLLETWEEELENLSSGSIQQYLSRDSFRSLKVLLPPLSEQEQIVYYLDEKTSLIDEMVDKKKNKIELLKEYRTSLINTVVTKGLNPNVPMKDSGIEWIGEIPRHWELKRLKHLSDRIGDGLHSTPVYVDSSDYYFINGNNLVNGSIKINESTKCVDEDQYNQHYIRLNNNTLLLSINGTIGNLSYYNNEKVVLGKSSCYINLKVDIYKNHIFYILSSSSVKFYYSLEVTGTTIFNLSLKSVERIPIPLPPLSEQEQIVSYLDEKTSEIDKTIELENKKIELLKEYRQSLISNVVTGKIKVTIQ